MLRRPIFFILLVVFLLVALGWIIFSIPWGGSNGGSDEPQPAQKSLVDYANTDTKVRINQNGAIVNDKEHREVWITVSRGEVMAEVKQGYEGTTIKTARYKNNEIAYRVFLAGLDGLGFTKTQAYEGGLTESGACPSGTRYIFDASGTAGLEMHSWSTSCSSKIGTYGGKLSNTRELFQDQVVDYNDFVEDVDLN